MGLLIAMEAQLMFDTDILDWWENHQHLGLTQRFTTFFEQVLLQEISDRVVIFVDEIDTVLSVDFADDFFIAIRYFHQNRAQNPDLHRLSFVLLGVAAPGDLIRNQQRTPFNIGQPIDLRGFSVAEVQPLGAGLAQLLGISEPQALAVLEAVLHWTGGQPFLTQKVCQFMTATDSRPAPGEELAWVSALVQEKIIDRWEAQDTPPHLSTIRDRLTRSKEKTARLLGLYQNLLEQGDLPADDRPEQVELRLTGLVVKRDGRLQVFNRIYQSVFNRSWVVQALRDLRPYGDAIQEWLSSGRQDESRLLRGQALQEARQWAEGKSLGDDDRLFLDASLEIERREAELRLEAEQEANRILTAARDEAESQLQEAREQLGDIEQEKQAAIQEKETANQELDQTKQKTQRWIRWGTAAAAVASVGLAGVITWAGIRTQEAQQAKLEAQQAQQQTEQAKADLRLARQETI
ncbi:MAG: AAA-like domain-containing protein, partial [Prochlorotrichaceae cyanobacterium]